ncbi:hypothetical protein [Saccharolobus sp. E5-1-F]|uniref:hypothetical protein n=1 Tax=Saccharolobus sp. E5-1-F TaxID=2663019 RepID=UPI0039084286
MDPVILAQLFIMILRNLNLKPRKYELKVLALALTAYSLGVQITNSTLRKFISNSLNLKY